MSYIAPGQKEFDSHQFDPQGQEIEIPSVKIREKLNRFEKEKKRINQLLERQKSGILTPEEKSELAQILSYIAPGQKDVEELVNSLEAVEELVNTYRNFRSILESVHSTIESGRSMVGIRSRKKKNQLAQNLSSINSVLTTLTTQSKESATSSNSSDNWLSKEPNNSVNIATACSNFDKIYEETISTREPIVITREGSETVSVIPTAELNSLIETAYLFGSGENAARLLDALQRAKARTNKPRTIEDLRQELGLDKEEEKISA